MTLADQLLMSGVQKVITDMMERLKDPDLARLFENTFPSTLDTTVKYFDPGRNLAFIVTGVSSHAPSPQERQAKVILRSGHNVCQ